jgi:hypothetical protein
MEQAYTTVVRPTLEYASATWDPYISDQINQKRFLSKIITPPFNLIFFRGQFFFLWFQFCLANRTWYFQGKLWCLSELLGPHPPRLTTEHSTSEDSDIDESSQAQDRLVNTDW